MKVPPNVGPLGALLTVAAAFGFLLGMYYMEDKMYTPRVGYYIPLARPGPQDVLSAVGAAAQQQTHQEPPAVPQHLQLPAVWPFHPHQPPWTFKGVLQPPVSEGDMKLVPLCNATYLEQHPLQESDYQRSYTPGIPCSMPPGLLHKIQSGAPVKIVVVGGSMTQGRKFCVDGERSWQSCAWSSRVQDRLNEVFKGNNVTVINKALAGYAYRHWLSSGMMDSLTEADVVVVDEQVNSAAYGLNAYTQMQGADEFLHSLLSIAHSRKRQIGVLFVESIHTCGDNRNWCNHHCGKEKGQQGKYTTSIKGHNTTLHWCHHWWSAADIERPVVQHYGFPIASYRDAIWPNLNKPRSDLPCLWNGKYHPGAITHSIMGDVVAYGLLRALLDSSAGQSECAEAPPRAMFHSELETVQYCSPGMVSDSLPTVTGTFMSTFEPAGFQPVKNGSWYWREDSPGKPGWIYDAEYTPAAISTAARPAPSRHLQLAAPASNRSHESTIWFKVYIGKQLQLQVRYLVTYANIGAVEVTVHRMAATQKFDNSTALAGYTINAKHDDTVSVPKTALFVHPGSPVNSRTKAIAMGLQLPKTVTQGYYVVALRPLSDGKDSKFKLLGLASC